MYQASAIAIMLCPPVDLMRHKIFRQGTNINSKKHPFRTRRTNCIRFLCSHPPNKFGTFATECIQQWLVRPWERTADPRKEVCASFTQCFSGRHSRFRRTSGPRSQASTILFIVQGGLAVLPLRAGARTLDQACGSVHETRERFVGQQAVSLR